MHISYKPKSGDRVPHMRMENISQAFYNAAGLFDKEEMEQVIGNIPCNPDLLDLMVTDDEIEQNAVAILSALSDKERTLYILHYKRHIKLKDIAKRQKLPEATVRKQHQRLKKKLLKMINNL